MESNNDSRKRYSLLLLGGGIGGLLTLGVAGAATLPVVPILGGAGGVVLLSLSAWWAWIGVVLLFVNLSLIVGLFTLPSPWQEGFIISFLVLVILLLGVRLREKPFSRASFTLPLLCWCAVVIFSALPAMKNQTTADLWFAEAMPLLLPGLALVIPRKFAEHASLNKFLLVILLLSLPMVWDFTTEFLQLQTLYGQSAQMEGMQQFRLSMFQPLRESTEVGEKGTYILWFLEALPVWLFFVVLGLAVGEVSKVKKAILVLLATYYFLAIFLLMRRTGLLSLLFGSLLFAVLLYLKRGKPALMQCARLWLLIGLLCALAVLGLSLSRYVNVDRLLSHYVEAYLRGVGDPSFQWRGAEFPVALSAFRESPWIGHGWGYVLAGIASIYPEAKRYEDTYYLHNFWLNLLVKTGLLGVAVFIWFMVATWRTLLRALRMTSDPLYYSLLLAGACLLAAILFRSPLDDMFTSFPTLYPLAVTFAIARRVEFDSRVPRGVEALS